MLSVLLAFAVAVADESVKVRPQDPFAPSPSPSLKLVAAGGECAGAQLVVRGPLRGLRASATEGIDLYRVATIELAFPSGIEGATGEWPDALIPARDALFGEARNAFPVDVGAGRNQSIFVEACVARGAAAGRRGGKVTLTAEGGSSTSVPVEIRARGFDLPQSLATAFGFSGYTAAAAHQSKDHTALTRAYDALALRRGITLFGGTQDAPPHEARGDSEVSIHWQAYDAEVAPFLDARPGWTSVELREPAKLTRAQRRSWRRQWVAHFKEHHWLDRLFAYVHDEPAEKDFAEVERKARELAEDAPEIPRLVTTAFSPKLPSVDRFTPVINCARSSRSCPRAASEEHAPRWWYQSCMSHGCGWNGKPVIDEAFRGWPSYMIDAPATAARAMGALAFVNGIEGELYFDVVYAYDHGDPWKSQWAFGGNGDGTLYYPGTPERIGGAHDVPVESLRILQISRGLADHAYLSLCAQLGDPQLARAEAQALAPSLTKWSRDPHAYAAMRARVGARIEALLLNTHAAR